MQDAYCLGHGCPSIWHNGNPTIFISFGDPTIFVCLLSSGVRLFGILLYLACSDVSVHLYKGVGCFSVIFFAPIHCFRSPLFRFHNLGGLFGVAYFSLHDYVNRQTVGMPRPVIGQPHVAACSVKPPPSPRARRPIRGRPALCYRNTGPPSAKIPNLGAFGRIWECSVCYRLPFSGAGFWFSTSPSP